MESRERHAIEGESRGQYGDSPHAMTCGARTLRVAARTEVAGAGSANTVLAEPIAIVHEVADGWSVLGGKVEMAAVAVS